MDWKDQEEVIEAFLRLMPDRDRHEFGLWAAEQVKYLMKDDRSLKALDVKRLWLDGKATDEELKDAWAAAGAAWDAAGDAARDAAGAAAWAAAAAGDGAAAWAAAGAAWDAAGDAAWAAARAAARRSQSEWILKNYKDRIHQALVYEAMTQEAT